MKLVILFLLPITLYSQEFYPVPVKIFDSLTFEVRVSRQCLTTLGKAETQIQTLQSINITYGKEIQLRKEEVSQIESFMVEQQKEYAIIRDQNEVKSDKQESKIRKLWKVVTIQGVGIVVLVLVL